MPNILECQSNRSAITELKVLDNNLVAYSTKYHGIRVISPEDCSIKLNVNKLHEHLASARATAFSPNAEFLAFCVQSLIYIIHMPSKIVMKTIHTDNEEIEILSFDLESKYIIAGTAGGRVLQYRYDGSSLLARLCSFNKSNQKENTTQSFVSAFTFYKNRLACASHNGEIFIVDLHSRANLTKISNSTIRINTLCFLNENTLMSGSAEGKICINHLEKMKEPKEVETAFRSISKIILMSNPNYVMISGDANHLSIYDIKKGKVVHNKYVEFKGRVENIALIKRDTLIAVIENSDLYRIELPSIARLKSLIIQNKLDSAFNLCDKDFMIKESKEYKELQDSYDKIYLQAAGALINQQKTSALQLLDIFKNVPSKKEEIALLFKAFENYPRLQTLYLEKKYTLAYALCALFPPLEHTFQYKKMEEAWKDAFMNAQRQILLGRDEMAKSLLNEYVTVVSKRPIIKLMLNHNKKFIEFLKAIETKNFQKVNEIAKTNDSFTQIPTYKSLGNDIEFGLSEINSYIKKGNIDLARESLKKFQEIPSIALEITKLTQSCQNMQELQKAYEIKNFKLCYEILDANSSLSFSELGELLERGWVELIQTSEEYALKGNIKDIKTTLGELIRLESRREKIGDLLRVSFHTKIKMLLAKKSFKSAENIIYSYIDIFGLDTEMSSLMKLYEAITKTKLAITQTSRQIRDSWIHSEIIMGL